MSVKKEPLNNPLELQTDWRSIYIATLLTFVGSVQFSLYFSAMWPFLQILDPDITESFFGLAIAVYSLGQCISSPGFGVWSNYVKAVKQPLSCGLQLMLVGNVLYLLMELVDWIAPRYLLLIGRLEGAAAVAHKPKLPDYDQIAVWVSLFSQILGPRRQAVEQGFLQVAAGVARMVGPVTAGNLYGFFGPRPVWWLEFVVTVLVLALWFVFYQRMVPLRLPRDLLPSVDLTASSVSTLTSTQSSAAERDEKPPV
ncbi:MFS domain-containing protein [Aphelenchoides fujianensis]|nr:MFS domain-containing protein [Aphelenchoides fujianensis]